MNFSNLREISTEEGDVQGIREHGEETEPTTKYKSGWLTTSKREQIL